MSSETICVLVPFVGMCFVAGVLGLLFAFPGHQKEKPIQVSEPDSPREVRDTWRSG